MTDFTQVTILNSETKMIYPFTVYQPRLDKLKDFILNSDIVPPPAWGGDAVDGTAVYAMSLIFTEIPHKFPLKDIMVWLQGYIKHDVSLPVIEEGLKRFINQEMLRWGSTLKKHPNWMFDNVKGDIETPWQRFIKLYKVVLPGNLKTCGRLNAQVDIYLDDGDVWIGAVGDSRCSWTSEGITDDLEKCLYQQIGG